MTNKRNNIVSSLDADCDPAVASAFDALDTASASYDAAFAVWVGERDRRAYRSITETGEYIDARATLRAADFALNTARSNLDTLLLDLQKGK